MPGLNYLGADSDVREAEAFKKALIESGRDRTDPGWRQREIEADRRAQQDKVVGALSKMVAGTVIGAVAGGTGGALLWPAHRFLGGLLAALLLGMPLGGMVGTALAARNMKVQP